MRLAGSMVALVLLATSSLAQQAPQPTYEITGLSQDDILIIGAALDELPRKTTDRNGLYARMQAQITRQANELAAKSKADADKVAAKADADRAAAAATASGEKK
jgi:hypothetical protein